MARGLIVTQVGFSFLFLLLPAVSGILIHCSRIQECNANIFPASAGLRVDGGLRWANVLIQGLKGPDRNSIPRKLIDVLANTRNFDLG